MKRTVYANNTLLDENEAVECNVCNPLEISDESVDFHILKIIAFTINEGRTVREISLDLSIPLVKAYQLVDWMENQGLLIDIGKVRTALHGKASIYSSTIRSGKITIEKGKLTFLCKHMDGSTKERVCEVKAKPREGKEKLTP